tara:strand:+ start:12820 stop:13938 length:1119 start_codon:yes stop_codon:yes gene_type:complete
LKILYFTNIFPHYRLPIWRDLSNSKKFYIDFFYSKSNSIGIKTGETNNSIENNFKKRLHYIKNFKFNGHVFWQSKSLSKSLFSNYDVIFLLGDMKIINNWIIPIIARLRNKKIVFWTHGIYGNESFLKTRIRLLFLKLANDILLYEKNAKTILLEHGFEPDSLHVVFNSLNYYSQKQIFNELSKQNGTKSSIRKIIFMGRLTRVKRLDMLIKAIIKLNRSNILYSLKLIGEGPDKEKLIKLASEGIRNNYITFYGSIYNEEEIGAHIFNSDLCVSPGNVGLTCIHSLTYGTPVCTHSNIINQMPEFEAIKEGVNGTLFKEDDIDDLELKIKTWFEKYHQKNTKLSIRKVVDEDYNPHNQIRIINNMIDKWQK